MALYVGLLRAVNVAGRNRVSMGDLRALLEGLGFSDARTLLQSGNVVFRADGATTRELERTLATACAERLGVRTEFFVRTAKDWRSVVANNPFPSEAAREPNRLLVAFLEDAPSAAAEALRAAITGRETFQVIGRHAYVFYPDGFGRSRLTTSVLESKLRTRATARNWNTVLKLAAMVE